MAEPLLVAREIRKTYRDSQLDVPVLRGVDLSIAEGEWVAILGTSGSGKSTLLHILGGLDRPDQGGRVEFQGSALSFDSGAAMNAYRNTKVGFVFQFYHLLPELNVLENALLPSMVGGWGSGVAGRLTPARERCQNLLGELGLGHRLGHRPSQLSGGERQRTAIARALINDPKVLLADEPTGNLDVETGAGILDLLIERHRKGLTIAMVTHDPAIAARADRVVRLVNGRTQ